MKGSFNEWFRKGNSPQLLILKACEDLEWPDELKDDAIYVVERVRHELEACHPTTIVAVAIYMLNLRMDNNALRNTIGKYASYKRSEQKLVEKLNINALTNIKEKYERVRAFEIRSLPERWLLESEKQKLRHEWS